MLNDVEEALCIPSSLSEGAYADKSDAFLTTYYLPEKQLEILQTFSLESL